MIHFQKHCRLVLFLICIVPIVIHAQGQDCNCTIKNVVENTVMPCNKTIGTEITVFNTSQLYTAINNVNASGGNATILISNGTYPIASTSWYPYITASNLVIRSLSGNRDSVILTGTGMKSVSPDTEIGIYAVGNNITIADLTIKEVGNHGIATVGDSLFVHNVRIQNTYEQMIKGNAVGDGPDHGIVQCSLMEYPAGIGPQYYIGGIDIHMGNNWIVRDNVFRNIESPSGSVAEHAVHFWNNGADNTIERNLIFNCDRGIGFGLGNSPNTGGIIRNNMIYNEGTGIFNDVGIGLENSPGTRVYNNTVYINYKNAIEYRFASTVNIDIKNNLTNKTIKERDGAQANLATNIETAQSDWFADLLNGDLHLVSKITEVVDQGTDLSSDVKEDIDKILRPQGVAFDIGAQEYKTTTGKEEKDILSEYSIFPNPANSSFTIKAYQLTNLKFSIHNILGEIIYGMDDINSNKEKIVDCSQWPNGLYYCCFIDSNSKEQCLKLVKMD